MLWHFFHWEVGSNAPLLEFGLDFVTYLHPIKCSRSDAVWLWRLGHKMQYSFHLTCRNTSIWSLRPPCKESDYPEANVPQRSSSHKNRVCSGILADCPRWSPSFSHYTCEEIRLQMIPVPTCSDTPRHCLPRWELPRYHRAEINHLFYTVSEFWMRG